MTAGSRSLLEFLDAPVVVGDPDGCAVYANPAFESAFHVSGEASHGTPLAELFEGGAREAVLGAVARVCEGSDTARFRMREGDVGYAALASPIEAEQGRVGVIILLTKEFSASDVGSPLPPDIQEPLEELGRCLDELAEHVSGQSDRRLAELLEGALRALEYIRKRSEGPRTMLPDLPDLRG